MPGEENCQYLQRDVVASDGGIYELSRVGELICMGPLRVTLTKNGAPLICGKGRFAGKKDGLIYPWESAVKAAPTGFHCPSDEEWMCLERVLGMAEDDLHKIGERKISQEGGFLLRKLFSTTFAIQTYGDSGRWKIRNPAQVLFWSSTQGPSDDMAWNRYLFSDSVIIRGAVTKKSYLCSICIEDY